MRATISILALCAWCSVALADTLVGKVVGLADGDTLTVLDEGNMQHKIRLAGIDAPEKGQPWGQKSKEALSDKVYGRSVTVEWHKRDKFGRLVGKVMVEGQDANLAQVVQGLAWHYKQYQSEQTPEDRDRYAAAEIEARKGLLGLWSDPDSTPPWDWRRMKREKASASP